MSDNTIANYHAIRINLRPDAVGEVIGYQAIFDSNISIVAVKPQTLGQIIHSFMSTNNHMSGKHGFYTRLIWTQIVSPVAAPIVVISDAIFYQHIKDRPGGAETTGTVVVANAPSYNNIF